MASPSEGLVDIVFEQVRIDHVPSVLVDVPIVMQVPAVVIELGHCVFPPVGRVVIHLFQYERNSHLPGNVSARRPEIGKSLCGPVTDRPGAVNASAREAYASLHAPPIASTMASRV